MTKMLQSAMNNVIEDKNVLQPPAKEAVLAWAASVEKAVSEFDRLVKLYPPDNETI